MGSHRSPHAIAAILSKFCFSLSYRVATTRYCFSRAKAFLHFSPTAGIYTSSIHICVTLQHIAFSQYYNLCPLLVSVSVYVRYYSPYLMRLHYAGAP